jgi:hypothetical protein
MSLKKTLSGVLPFAQLLSNGPRAARAEEDDREEDDDKKKGRRAEDDQDEADDNARRADDDSDDADAEDEDAEDEDGKKGKKARKAKRADKDNNDVDGDDADAADEDGEGDEGAEDGDEEEDTAKKAARARERTRCARIVAHGIKIGAVRQAGVFAFDTRMSSKAAIAALNASAVDNRGSRRASLSDRMAGARVANPGASSASSQPSVAEMIVAAGRRARGEV